MIPRFLTNGIHAGQLGIFHSTFHRKLLFNSVRHKLLCLRQPSGGSSITFWSTYLNGNSSRPFSTETNDHDPDCIEHLDDIIESLDSGENSWWALYVRGKVPDYPPRREMYTKLTKEGIDVERMLVHEVEDFTRWLLMREKYGPKYPKMPYDVTLEQKIAELKKRVPLKKGNCNKSED